jgi:hypothetical protein
MVDAGRVDDARSRIEAVAIQARRRLVERDVIEHLGQGLLVEVAADDRHGVDRCGRRHPQATKRGDQATAGGVGQR